MRLSFSSGITLSELLIATLIVSVMLVGIASTDFAIRRMDRDAHHDTILYMQTQALAENIRQAAMAAVGDDRDGLNDTKYQGVQEAGFLQNNPSFSGDNFLCFRSYPGSDLTNYTDSRWRCFTMYSRAAGLQTTDVYACDRTEPDIQDYHNTGTNVVCAQTDQFLGTMVPNSYMHSFGNGIYHFKFKNRTDTLSPMDVNTNPEVSISQDVFLESHNYSPP